MRYFTARHADATRRAYRCDWTRYTAWCDARGLCALPAAPETVAAFLAWEAGAGRKVSTIRRRVAAIRLAHRLCDHEPPTNAELVHGTVRGIARTHGSAPNQKAPALAELLRLVVDTLDDATHQGRRDRALLTLGMHEVDNPAPAPGPGARRALLHEKWAARPTSLHERGSVSLANKRIF